MVHSSLQNCSISHWKVFWVLIALSLPKVMQQQFTQIQVLDFDWAMPKCFFSHGAVGLSMCFGATRPQMLHYHYHGWLSVWCFSSEMFYTKCTPFTTVPSFHHLFWWFSEVWKCLEIDWEFFSRLMDISEFVSDLFLHFLRGWGAAFWANFVITQRTYLESNESQVWQVKLNQIILIIKGNVSCKIHFLKEI